MNTTFMTYKEENDVLRKKCAEQADRIKELEGISECHAIDLRERDRSIKHWSGKCAEQAVVIESLKSAIGVWERAEDDELQDAEAGLINALDAPTDSKQILAEWLDKVLGEPSTFVDKDTLIHKANGEFAVMGDPLFKKPEIK